MALYSLTCQKTFVLKEGSTMRSLFRSVSDSSILSLYSRSRSADMLKRAGPTWILYWPDSITGRLDSALSDPAKEGRIDSCAFAFSGPRWIERSTAATSQQEN